MTTPTAPPAAPTVPLYPALGSPTFNADAYVYGTGMPGVVTGIQALAGNAFTIATAAKEQADSAAASAASAQLITAFKGPWSTLTGALAMPATVLYNNTYWVLIANAADVTLETPGVSSKWAPQVLQAQNIGAADLNTVVNGGAYVGASPTNGPTGVTSAIVNVIRSATSCVQELFDITSGSKWHRTINAITTTPTYSAWGRQTLDNTPGVAAVSGVMDCSKGTYFTATIAGNTTLSFTNIPSGAYACVLEVTHTSGTITQPSNAVWVAGSPPTLTTGTRHLFYYQKALTGSGGFIVSCLPNSAA